MCASCGMEKFFYSNRFMKKFCLFSAALLALAACNKEEAIQISSPADGEIVLSLGGEMFNATVETKTSALSDVPASLYLQRTTGSGSSETKKEGSASKTVSEKKIATGWYQTATPTAYNYYLSNNSITFAAGASTISASNTTDVIAGVTSGNNTVTPSVTLEHVFARTGTLTAKAPSGYTISGVIWEIQSNSGAGTSGTYNMAAKTWSGTTALAKQTITGTSDLYLVPGSYKVSLSYTLTKGEWTKSTTKSADVTLTAGKINNLKIGTDGTVPLIDGGAKGISITVSLNPWGSTDITVPLT